MATYRFTRHITGMPGTVCFIKTENVQGDNEVSVTVTLSKPFCIAFIKHLSGNYTCSQIGSLFS